MEGENGMDLVYQKRGQKSYSHSCIFVLMNGNHIYRVRDGIQLKKKKGNYLSS